VLQLDLLVCQARSGGADAHPNRRSVARAARGLMEEVFTATVK
jgi:hypothetical protein